MKGLIFTEGSSLTGFGHVTRCTSFYQALEAEGLEVLMAVNAGEELLPFLKGLNYRLVNWLEDRTELESLLKDADFAVVDSYYATEKTCEKISSEVKRALFLDDLVRMNYPKGLVLNGAVGAEDMDYPFHPSVEYLLGVQYQPMRSPFWETRVKEHRDDLSEVLLTFGGSDVRELAPVMTEKLLRSFPDLKIHILIGSGALSFEKISSMGSERVLVHTNLSGDEVRDLMLNCDLAITAAGQTTYELAACGVPMILIGVAENQKKNIEGWVNTKAVRFAGWWTDKRLWEKVQEEMKAFSDSAHRRSASILLQQLCDGGGVLRAAQALIEDENEDSF